MRTFVELNTRRVVALVVSAGALVMPLRASAQTPSSQRSFQELFTADDRRAGERDRLNLALWLTEAYDDDVYADLSTGIQPGVAQRPGYYTMLLAGIDYGRQRKGVGIGASASSALRYYSNTREAQAVSHTAAVGFSAELPQRLTLFVNQTAAYSPSYLYGLFPAIGPVTPGEALPAAPDYEVVDLDSYTYGTRAELSRNFSRRNTLSVTGEYRRTDVVHESEGYHDLTWYRARAQFTRQMTRNAALRIAYWHRQGEFGHGQAGVTSEDSLEVGTDYIHPLSATRRATFGFTLGSSMADRPRALQDAPLGTYYRLQGDARLGYQWGRSWTARAVYRRGFEYVANFPDPVFVDGFTGQVEGSFTRRFDLFGFVGYSTGDSALRRNGYFLDTYTGDARLGYAITKHITGYVEYLRYFYEVRGDTQGRVNFPREMQRDGVRAGVMFNIPVLGR